MDVNLGILYMAKEGTPNSAGNAYRAPDTETGEELTSYKQHGCRSSVVVFDYIG